MPTCVRGRGVALVNVMSMISMVAAPAIVYSVCCKVKKNNSIVRSGILNMGIKNRDCKGISSQNCCSEFLSMI